jgi:hypothetical protein
MSIFGTPAFQSGGVRSLTSLPAGAVNTATGDLIIVGVAWSDSGTITAVNDTALNTYVPLTAATGDLGGTGAQQFWYCIGATANAANIVTATESFANNYSTIAVWDVPVTAVPLFDAQSAQGAGGTGNTGNITTVGADEFIAAFAVDGQGTDSYTRAGSYTLDGSYGTFSGACHGYLVAPVTASPLSIFASVPGGALTMGVGFKAPVTNLASAVNFGVVLVQN